MGQMFENIFVCVNDSDTSLFESELTFTGCTERPVTYHDNNTRAPPSHTETYFIT